MSSTVLELDGMTVPVKITGSSRRAKLTIERDGSFYVSASADVELGELMEFLNSKRDWIYRKLAEKEVLHYEPVVKQLVNGEGFLYLGRNHRLRVSVTGRQTVSLDHGRMVLPDCRRAEGAAPIISWYETRGADWLRPRTTRWSERLRVNPAGAVEVTDLGHKWGAATPTGRVRIHWATMQLRPILVDYVLAHELAHLREPHHGPSFWNLLGRVMPDYGVRKAELAQVGKTLWLGKTA